MRRWGWMIGLALMAGCGRSAPSVSPSPVPSTPSPVIVAPPPAPAPVIRGPGFNQGFWNEFVHNGFDQPTAFTPLRRLTASTRIYLKTVDEAGLPIPAFTLQTAEEAVNAVALTWGGGVIGILGIERGTGTREGQSGWQTVKWPNPAREDLCGQALVAVDGGWLELNYLIHNANCKCNGSEIRPQTVKHELGHVFGYYHTDSQDDLMRSGAIGCDKTPSAREAYHAELAYRSPVGTSDARAASRPVLIVD